MFTKCLLDKILLIWYNIIKIRQGKVLKTRKVRIMGKTVEEMRMDIVKIIMENFEMLRTISEELSYVLDEGSVMEILAHIVDKLEKAEI